MLGEPAPRQRSSPGYRHVRRRIIQDDHRIRENHPLRQGVDEPAPAIIAILSRSEAIPPIPFVAPVLDFGGESQNRSRAVSDFLRFALRREDWTIATCAEAHDVALRAALAQEAPNGIVTSHASAVAAMVDSRCVGAMLANP